MGKTPIILAALCLLALAGCMEEAAEKDYFPLGSGESLEYSYSMEITSAAGTQTESLVLEIRPGALQSTNNAECWESSFLFDGLSDHSECYYMGEQGVMLAARKYGLETQDIEPHLPLLKKPFTAGTAWEWTGKEGEIESRAEFEIQGIETIEISGRDFEALAVLATVERSDGARIVSTRWYAEGIGLVKEEMTITNSNYPGTKMRIELELE